MSTKTVPATFSPFPYFVQALNNLPYIGTSPLVDVVIVPTTSSNYQMGATFSTVKFPNPSSPTNWAYALAWTT